MSGMIAIFWKSTIVRNAWWLPLEDNYHVECLTAVSLGHKQDAVFLVTAQKQLCRVGQDFFYFISHNKQLFINTLFNIEIKCLHQ